MEVYERMRKCSIAETLHQSSSCAICQSILRGSHGDLYLGTCTSDSAAQIKRKDESRCTVNSSACETLAKREEQQPLRCPEHQIESTNGEKAKEESEIKMYTKVKGENMYTKGENRGEGPEHCFLGSSVYYGGPDDLYDGLMRRKEGQHLLKMEVQQLEEAMDPSNREYTTRGSWWEGSLYY